MLENWSMIELTLNCFIAQSPKKLLFKPICTILSLSHFASLKNMGADAGLIKNLQVSSTVYLLFFCTMIFKSRFIYRCKPIPVIIFALKNPRSRDMQMQARTANKPSWAVAKEIYSPTIFVFRFIYWSKPVLGIFSTLKNLGLRDM